MDCCYYCCSQSGSCMVQQEDCRWTYRNIHRVTEFFLIIKLQPRPFFNLLSTSFSMYLDAVSTFHLSFDINQLHFISSSVLHHFYHSFYCNEACIQSCHVHTNGHIVSLHLIDHHTSIHIRVSMCTPWLHHGLALYFLIQYCTSDWQALSLLEKDN